MSITKQELRKHATHSQLEALRAQLQVIKSLDCEHAFGLENSMEADGLFLEAQQLVEDAMKLSAQRGKVDRKDFVESLKTFRDKAHALSLRAESFMSGARVRAKDRLDNVIKHEGEPLPGDAISSDPHRLAATAGQCCFGAEASQYLTFAMQITAICDLCCEMLFVDASGKAANSNS